MSWAYARNLPHAAQSDVVQHMPAWLASPCRGQQTRGHLRIAHRLVARRHQETQLQGDALTRAMLGALTGQKGRPGHADVLEADGLDGFFQLAFGAALEHLGAGAGAQRADQHEATGTLCLGQLRHLQEVIKINLTSE